VTKTPIPADPDFERRVRTSFGKQSIMATIGAKLTHIAPGEVEIALPVADHISQQHGFVHAGAVATIADSAAGYAALSLMPPGAGVLTTEFKINLMAPAAGDRLIARGSVVRAGRTLTVALAEVHAEADGKLKLVALLTASMMTIQGRDGVSD
jgi:uncharacterized protein (TIGR00369 family)